MLLPPTTHSSLFFFFFNDTATTEIYTLSLHDALPIWLHRQVARVEQGIIFSLPIVGVDCLLEIALPIKQNIIPDRKSTRLNSSHANISYAVFWLKKQKNKKPNLSKYIVEMNV